MGKNTNLGSSKVVPLHAVINCGNGSVASFIPNLGACLKTLARLVPRPLTSGEKASCTSRLSGPQRLFGIPGVEKNRKRPSVVETRFFVPAVCSLVSLATTLSPC